MRGCVARKLRNQARQIAKNLPSQLMVNRLTGQQVWTGFRRIYQDLKKEYKECRKRSSL